MGELQCFHSSKIASFLAWVEVSCSAKEHLISKSTDDYLVNRLSFSPCPHGTPKFTRVVKCETAIIAGEGIRKGWEKTKVKTNYFKVIQKVNIPTISKEAKIPALKLWRKRMFPVSFCLKISL